MNIDIKETEKDFFSIGDIIVSYSNIEITHVNDNKPPIKVLATKIILWGAIIAMIAALFLL
ncbi:MAG: hypothetical protein LBF57_03485 [Holosporaceae bacterium]|jgi:hypothetical protein|nr:hypothetical protein [Holosporaceae bacterium]